MRSGARQRERDRLAGARADERLADRPTASSLDPVLAGMEVGEERQPVASVAIPRGSGTPPRTSPRSRHRRQACPRRRPRAADRSAFIAHHDAQLAAIDRRDPQLSGFDGHAILDDEETELGVPRQVLEPELPSAEGEHLLASRRRDRPATTSRTSTPPTGAPDSSTTTPTTTPSPNGSSDDPHVTLVALLRERDLAERRAIGAARASSALRSTAFSITNVPSALVVVPIACLRRAASSTALSRRAPASSSATLGDRRAR